MWLINARDYRLEEFPSRSADDFTNTQHGRTRPAYSILSHRWEDEEVTFQLMGDDRARRQLKGFQKIKQCCQQTLRDGIGYTWIDTCCINKEDPRELSEAINSMFRWYREADVCYTYLHDVTSPSQIHDAVWFTRAWTLQELIAPRKLIFFDQSWSQLGDRRTLVAVIVRRTAINPNLLLRLSDIGTFSIAERMSWAATRKSARPEDRVYSLLGIFHVSMPMLYGEGYLRAFQRLQREIIRQVNDQSIFAWSMAADPAAHGLLARSATTFARSSDIHPCRGITKQGVFILTNLGLSISLRMKPLRADIYLAVLSCERAERPGGNSRKASANRLGIFLRRLRPGENIFDRVQVDGEDLVSVPLERALEFREEAIYVRQRD